MAIPEQLRNVAAILAYLSSSNSEALFNSDKHHHSRGRRGEGMEEWQGGLVLLQGDCTKCAARIKMSAALQPNGSDRNPGINA